MSKKGRVPPLPGVDGIGKQIKSDVIGGISELIARKGRAPEVQYRRRDLVSCNISEECLNLKHT